MLIEPRNHFHLIDVEPDVELHVVCAHRVFYLFQVPLDVVFPVPEYVHATVSSSAVPLTEDVGGYLVHVLAVIWMVFLVLVWVDLGVVINGFLSARN